MHEIAIIGAMDIEIRKYLEQATCVSEIREGNFTFLRGVLFGSRVVIASSGTGKVLAALTTQKLIDACHPTAVIMIGVAGALTPDLKIGDVVISDDCVQHDVDVTALGYPRGVVPDTDQRFIRADRRLVSLAMTTKLEQNQLVLGRILSGDQFFTTEETKRRAYLFDELHGSAIEMEGAALALVCKFNAVPFVITRIIGSELEGNQEDQYRDSLPVVANHSFKVVEAILSQWELFPQDDRITSSATLHGSG